MTAGAVWLADPGPITLGATFRTVLYLRCSPGAPAQQVLVEVVFDPRMVYCVALEPPPPGGPAVSHDVTIALGRVAARVTFRDAAHAAGRVEGVPAATVQWRCTGEGETRVEARLIMPETLPSSSLRIAQRPR